MLGIREECQVLPSLAFLSPLPEHMFKVNVSLVRSVWPQGSPEIICKKSEDNIRTSLTCIDSCTCTHTLTLWYIQIFYWKTLKITGLKNTNFKEHPRASWPGALYCPSSPVKVLAVIYSCSQDIKPWFWLNGLKKKVKIGIMYCFRYGCLFPWDLNMKNLSLLST